ncbi:translation initiation factor IF-2 subunit gamma [Candidatus Poseidoniales archaeon]|nr:translation initiation factor IF-2 subunit gamma [Candidatus Poseidoniales archaeon]MDB2367082.1 translation initiation factor IF-2 subunit gamma [Candidatus Poseidoniales archaeon]MDB2671295.1 translation initiation factor IF-2 subunit gamma [Candidatus Poseidoniales archaeon]|tara:strand:+ start:283 stop:1521 length:1239 start_codon:yes stop_codon:yes gene_type:complete
MARTLPSQPEVNIGLVGHVDHGKTTLTQALSGVWTDTHSEERRRGISIKLGYADTAFYKTDSGQYYATGRRPEGGKDIDSELQRVVSFVDAPGHETLMAIMITGASIMDGAMLMVAANETCPQPQTREHLMALEIAGIKNIVIVQNKIDLVTKERAMESYNEIKEFLEGTIAQNAPVIPVSAHHDVNLDILIEAIEQTIPTPNRQEDERAVMHIARSFDVNRPGTRPAKLTGGVIGGSIVEGAFREGDEIIIGPGRKIEQGNKTRWEPIETTITSMQGGGGKRDVMMAGGLCGLGTLLDPSITTADNLSGQVLAKKGELPTIRTECSISVELMDTMVSGDGEGADKIYPLRNNEMLMVNVATSTSVGVVKGAEKGKATLHLRLPICADEGQRVSLSRRVGARWRLIGHGTIQ